MELAGFAAEFKLDAGAVGLHVPMLQRGQAVVMVFLGVFLVPHADGAQIHHAHDGREDLFTTQSRSKDVLDDVAADLRD